MDGGEEADIIVGSVVVGSVVDSVVDSVSVSVAGSVVVGSVVDSIVSSVGGVDVVEVEVAVRGDISEG